jgi:hypothetical protein
VLKEGYKTTEFFIVVLTNIGLVLASSADWLTPHYAAIGAAVSSAAYALARGLAKLNPPKDSVPVPPAPAPPAV